MLKGLEVKNEEEMLRRAAAYCDAHAPQSLQSLVEDPATLEAFLGALSLAKIPEKKARKAVAPLLAAARPPPAAPDRSSAPDNV